MKPLLSLTFAALLATATAHAATITWGTGQLAGESDILTAGTTVFAFNLGNASGTYNAPNVTLNGVDFQNASRGSASYGNPYSFAYQSSSGSVTSFTMQKTGGGSNGFINGNNTRDMAANLPTGAEWDNYRQLLQTTFDTTGAGLAGITTTYSLTFSNLVVGNQYTIQMWVNVGYEDTPADRYPTFSNADSSDTGTLLVSPGDTNTLGSWVTGTFVADSDDITINLTAKGWSKINAVQLRDLGSAAVPEPTTASLGLLALVGLAARRNRNRQQ